jgi:hypothetical protein
VAALDASTFAIITEVTTALDRLGVVYTVVLLVDDKATADDLNVGIAITS